MPVLTLDILKRGMTPAGGYNRKQIEAIGIEWPLVAGWKDRAVGKYVSADDIGRFMLLGRNDISKPTFDSLRYSDPQPIIDSLVAQTTRQAAAIRELNQELAKLKSQQYATQNCEPAPF